jgi:hypothetical protein
MRFTFGLITFVFLCFATALSAQSAYEGAIGRYVEDHNKMVAMSNWAKVERAAVSMYVNEANELEVAVHNDCSLRLTLQRDEASDLDGLFPREMKEAIIIITNETAVIIDPVEKLHFAISLNAEPPLPAIAAEPLLVFEGYGLTRHWDDKLR